MVTILTGPFGLGRSWSLARACGKVGLGTIGVAVWVAEYRTKRREVRAAGMGTSLRGLM
jgi:hypothetical protein